MKRLFWLVGVLLIVGGLVLGRELLVGAEVQGDLPAKEAGEVVRFRLMTVLPFRVKTVEPNGSGQIELEFPQRSSESMARSGLSPEMIVGLSEGYYLGLVGFYGVDRGSPFGFSLASSSPLEDDANVVRVQVLEVEKNVAAVVKFGARAAKQLEQGDVLLLVRPGGSTTAQLQAVPEIVALTDARDEVPGMSPRMAAQLAQSKNNLKQIALSMHNYHDVHSHFPPAVIYGPDGKPWHSWRVLLLPYLEKSRVYEQYKFDEPWDGPNNKRLLENMPSVYRDPVYDDGDSVHTHYAVPVGAGAAFSPEGHQFDGDPDRVFGPEMGKSLRDFSDGTSNSILAGSVSPDRQIPWTKPEDVVFDDDFPGIGKAGGFAAPYKTDTASGGVFARADGSVAAIRSDVDERLLRHLIEIADGHPVGEVPVLDPNSGRRQRKIPVIEIRTTESGATAKLRAETLQPSRQSSPREGSAPSKPIDSPRQSRSSHNNLPDTTEHIVIDSPRQSRSSRNLKQLVLALHNYHDAHRRLPPAYSTDEQGQPLLSWRVQILPYLGAASLYEEFHLDEPWDSEHNKRLIGKMPRVFQPPDGEVGTGKTTYLGVSGETGVFPGEAKVSLGDITDGTSNTIMIVEANEESAVVWTQPKDYLPDSKASKKVLLREESGGFWVGFSDGAVRLLSHRIDKETLQALLTRNGNEPVDRARFDISREGRSGASGRTAPPRPQTTEVEEAVEPVQEAAGAARARLSKQPTSREQAVAAIKELGGKCLAQGYRATWSPDGQRIAFGIASPSVRLQTGGGIGIHNLETGKTTQLVEKGKDPSWSPKEGRFIAYVVGYGREEEVWLVDASGGEPRKLADGGMPAWSADGTTVLFHSRQEGKLMSVPVDEQPAEPKELIKLSFWYPAISADGTRVAYRSSTSRSGSSLIVADVKTGRVMKRVSVPVGGRGFLGGWSPDGRQVGFGGFGAHDPIGLWIVDVDTGHIRRFSAGPLTMPAWSPDGSRVAFDLRTGEGSEVWMVESKALQGLEPMASDAVKRLVDRYAVPEGGVAGLLKFVEDLRDFRPRSRQEYLEHQRKAPAALKTAARKILSLEKDQWSEAYQMALRVLLEDRIRTIRTDSATRQRQTADLVKTFLKIRLERELEPQDASLAMSAATTLEHADRHELAAEAYRVFAELIAKKKHEDASDQQRLSAIVSKMEGAARRLSLLGNEMRLEGTTIDGTPFDWDAYRGKVVLVDFWATWCGPCRAEIPNVKKHYERYHERGFEVVGISLDQDRETLEQFLEKEQIPWVTLHEPDAESQHPMAAYYGIMSIPTVFLVDRNGKVVSTRARGEELSRQLEKLLGPVSDQSKRE